MAASFVDRVVIHASGGSGGNGCVSVRREKFKPLGGPDGATGGNGGNIILVVDSQATTLLNYHRNPNQSAPNGTQGKGSLKQGTNGDDLILPVPDGTVVKNTAGELLADLTGEGTEFVVVKGGRGGLGNAALASKRRKAPGFALLGEPGEAKDIVLELKTVADVALVGYPSSGKSSLIAAMSAARPKIADYPFTTLVPNLGVVQSDKERFTIADVPGLIPGASEGKGLGLEFLRHIERCAVIAHVIDCATYEAGRDPVSDLEMIEAELAAYQGDLGDIDGYIPLMQRPRVVVLNKIDVPDARELAQFVKADLSQRGYKAFEVSAVSHEGLRELGFALAALVAEHRAALPVVSRKTVIRPLAVDGPAATVNRVKGPQGMLYQILGDRPERWVKQTDFANDEAVGYLADRLTRAGIEELLAKAGAIPGDAVVIGSIENGVVFDWEPSLSTGPELLGERGTDLRFDTSHRLTRAEKREQYYERMDAKAAAREELWNERRSGLWTEPEE